VGFVSCSCFVNRDIDYPLSHALFLFLFFLFFFPISTDLGVLGFDSYILGTCQKLELFFVGFYKLVCFGFLILIYQNLALAKIWGVFLCWVVVVVVVVVGSMNFFISSWVPQVMAVVEEEEEGEKKDDHMW
jgi:hypothetical protein